MRHLKKPLRLVLMAVTILTVLTGPLAFEAIAQQPDPTVEEFTDEEGNFDEAGYLAALAAARGSGETGGGAQLPLTGSDTGMLVGLGAAAVVIGSGAVLGGRQLRKSRSEAS